MKVLPRLAAALLAAALASAPALADTPPGNNSTIPAHVTLVARGPAGPDAAAGTVVVTVRDFSAAPVAGADVVLDFSACADVRLAEDQGDPGLSVNCPLHWVRATTDAAGVAQFTVMGSASGGLSPADPPSCLRIYADGVLLGGVSVAILDRDGVGGLTTADLSGWAADYFGGTNPSRADLDGNGAVTVADLAMWARAFFGGDDVLSAGPYCP